MLSAQRAFRSVAAVAVRSRMHARTFGATYCSVARAKARQPWQRGWNRGSWHPTTPWSAGSGLLDVSFRGMCTDQAAIDQDGRFHHTVNEKGMVRACRACEERGGAHNLTHDAQREQPSRRW